jgi:hypothetical protein
MASVICTPRHAAVLRDLQVADSALLLNMLDPLLAVEDSRCKHPAIHSPPGRARTMPAQVCRIEAASKPANTPTGPGILEAASKPANAPTQASGVDCRRR